MRRSLRILIALVVLNGGWMLFDGAHGLITGDYVTPSSGPHAGQLGPWSGVVESVGLEPRSTLMMSLFVGYGAAYLAVLVAFVRGASGAGRGLLVMAILGLWHLPFGTLINLIVMGLLVGVDVREPLES